MRYCEHLRLDGYSAGVGAINDYLNEKAESQAQFVRMVVGVVVAMVVLLVGVRFGFLSRRGIGKKKKRE